MAELSTEVIKLDLEYTLDAILVFLKSRPTIDVPLGMITPPLILLNFTRGICLLVLNQN